MKIKRFTGRNMREAMAKVRAELSDQAVILESRRLADGVEVVAAVDYDETLPQQSLRQAMEDERDWIPAASAEPEPLPRRSSAAPVATDPDLSLLRQEIGEVKALMQSQFAGLSWSREKVQQPQRAALFRAMLGLGLEPALARELCGSGDSVAEVEQAKRAVLQALARKLPVLPQEPLIDTSEGQQVLALVGPTGVGKTTTIAKLAARYASRHGTRDIALVSTDHYRIGAQEQLFHYGRLLGVPVQTARDGNELQQLLERLSDRKLVLIDTAGMGPRDRLLANQLSLLRPLAGKLRSYLVLPGSSSAGDCDHIVAQFRATPLAGCILTKLDEATRIGAALSASVRHQLALAWVCDGQRVPEDICAARADDLVRRACELARLLPQSSDEELLASDYVSAMNPPSHRFGGAHVAV
ncbi:MAG: flagellar biosynthesis protein FlhF [Stagnimonas sp.]|nr:flagellar biosynthesis protein FlhF [Stagnimonas sp.]